MEREFNSKVVPTNQVPGKYEASLLDNFLAAILINSTDFEAMDW